jgi:hypothetical protein
MRNLAQSQLWPGVMRLQSPTPATTNGRPVQICLRTAAWSRQKVRQPPPMSITKWLQTPFLQQLLQFRTLCQLETPCRTLPEG